MEVDNSHDSTLVADYLREIQGSQPPPPIEQSTNHTNEPIKEPVKTEVRHSNRKTFGKPPERFNCKTE